MSILKQLFGVLPDGRAVHRYFLQGKADIRVAILDFGGADCRGRLTDIVGGYDNLTDYVQGDGYQGALIGRWGNRIAGGRFTLDGQRYELFLNDGKNHLHGGKEGFSHKIFAVTEKDGDEPALELR